MAQEVDVVPLQFVQYHNDVLIVSYSDGSTLQLSPCGNQFVHEVSADADTSPFSGLRRVLQKSEFATSAFRPKVREALQFRNMFAARPFVCHYLIDGEDVETVDDADSCQDTVEWPTEVDSVVVTPNGRLQLQAKRPSSCIVHLSGNRQEFRSEFAIRPPASRLKDGASFRPIRITCHHSLRDVDRCWRPAVNLILEAIGIPDEDKKIDNGPNAPLKLPEPLPLRCLRQHMHRFHDSPPQAEDGRSQGHPRLGWLVCAEGRRLVKVLCLDGILYRLHLPPHLAVEIYPGDGSILVSNNLTGCFFTHFIPTSILDEDDESREDVHTVVERVYAVQSPPLSFPRKFDYDLGRVLAVGGRLCEYLAECVAMLGAGGDGLDTPADCCWLPSEGEEELEREFQRVLGRGRMEKIPDERGDEKEEKRTPTVVAQAAKEEVSVRASEVDKIEEEPEPEEEEPEEEEAQEEEEEEEATASAGCNRRILERHEVPDVGTFSAAASGRIHILFCDRVSLDMRADLTRRLALDHRPPPMASYDSCPDLPPAGYARIFTREGHFEVTRVQEPEPYYQRYINAALEWIDWVNASPDERRVFYTERPQPPCPRTELKKIECFNYILENSDRQFGTSRDSTARSDAAERARQIQSIEDTLARTSNFLKELESMKTSHRG